jgi:hypothetical protein
MNIIDWRFEVVWKSVAMMFMIVIFSMMMVSPAYADEERQGDEEQTPYQEVFAWLGKLGVILGALSLSWLAMKRKRVSKIPRVRKIAQLYDQIHQITGWSALGLVMVHGAYFSIFKWLEINTITGMLTLLMLAAVAIYGLLLSRRRLPRDRRIHFVLSLLWAVLTVIHAIDAIPFLVVVIGLSYGLIWWIERREAKL